MERLVDAWSDAELDPEPLAPVTAAMARHVALAAEARTIVDARPELARIAADVAAGTLSLADGVAALHEAEGAGERGAGNVLQASTRATRLLGAAQNVALKTAVAALRDAGDVVAILDDARAELADELRKLAPAIAGVASAEDAMRTSGRTATAWRSADALEGRRAALGRVWSALRELRVIDADTEPPLEFRAGTTTMWLVARANVAAELAAAV